MVSKVVYVRALVLVGIAVSSLAACPSNDGHKRRLSEKLYWLGRDYYGKAVQARNEAAREKFFDEALTNLKKAVRANEKNFLARNLLGYLYLQRADRELGMVEVAQCLRGEDGREGRRRADLLFNLAGKQFRLVTKAEPGCTNSWLGRINVAMHFERYAEAAALCKKVLDQMSSSSPKPSCSSQGDRAVAWANLGWARFKLGKAAQAETSLKRALFLAPKLFLARYWLGRVLFARKRYAEAVEELSRTTREFGLPQAAFEYLGLSYARLGRKAEAAKALERCIRLAPRSCAAEECRKYRRLMVGSAGRQGAGS